MLIGCGSKEPETSKPIFVNTKGLNEAIRSLVGIDINLQKQKTDSVYNLDNQFYLKLIEEMSSGDHPDCFNRAKIDESPIDLNGNKIIKVQFYDSLSSVMMDCFANNMLMSGCNKNSVDFLFILKNNWLHHMPGESGYQCSYSFFLARALRTIYK